MEMKDFDNLLRGDDSISDVEDYLKNNSSGAVVNPINHEEIIDNLRANAIKTANKYREDIATFDFSCDENIEKFAKKELADTIVNERVLLSYSESMLQYVFEMMRNDPDKRLINSFTKITEMMTKLNDNVISNVNSLNKVVIDRKNSERQDTKLTIMTNRIENTTNNNLMIGDKSKKMVFSLEDLDTYATTGNLEVYESCEIEE